MSSSYIVEPQETGTEKKDDTLIIVVNDDGTISVDQETLQNLIMNQSNANVSVVRVGQADTDVENGDITLTVDPPPFVATTVNTGGTTTDATGLVDPFMEMDPEQLERLETALQSEEAKQILGENVTAMLDMLTVEEQQNSIRYSVELDHCYTSRLSPTESKPREPLPPVTTSPNDAQYAQTILPSQSSQGIPAVDADSNTLSKTKVLVKTSKPVGRPRKHPASAALSAGTTSRSIVHTVGTPKSTTGHITPRNVTNSIQQRTAKEGEYEDSSMSSESSDSEPPSDNDSDFGPRGPRRGGVRARGGRKGLTTRGGSMAANRRRGSNKHMDMEQVRRLDIEMAAAVNAMKSPEKEDKTGRYSPVKGKKQLKTTIGRRKEDLQQVGTTAIINDDAPLNVEKPLQTTNQVKANLINANMIKGDMIITKPGQGKVNQRVTFVQKQVLMKPNELRNIGLKKQVMLPKGKFINQPGTKFFTTKDGKLVQVPITAKMITSSSPDMQIKRTIPQVSPTQQKAEAVIQGHALQVQHPAKPPTSQPVSPKSKTCDMKKEKRRSDGSIELPIRYDSELGKTPESKSLDGSKKHLKKDPRKSPGYVAESLGPALFSTPDIIRRVGSNGTAGGGVSNSPATGLAASASITATMAVADVAGDASGTSSEHINASESISSTIAVCTDSGGSSVLAATIQSANATLPIPHSISSEVMQTPESGVTVKSLATNTLERTTHPETTTANQESREDETAAVRGSDDGQKSSGHSGLPEHMQPAMDTGITTGIEGEENLLATLEMEASKHEEDLLAEALLLQEELGVDLADHPVLSEQAGPEVATTPVSTNTMLVSPLIISEQDAKNMQSGNVVPRSPTITSTPNVTRETPKRSTKDEKEPIQIVRGGRVITLPPIEAPATRSKRLQMKAESPVQRVLSGKQTEKFIIITNQHKAPAKDISRGNTSLSRMEEHNEQDRLKRQHQEHQEEEGLQKAHDQIGANGAEEEEEEDEEEEEEENSDSEDDPDRLWCICKRPHNNRFMICCDVCEDWFHGKCVHVSKAMGKQMEEKGIEWVCPNCAKKKAEEAKAKTALQSSIAGIIHTPTGRQRIHSDNLSEIQNVGRKSISSSTLLSSTAKETMASVLQSSTDQDGVLYSGSMQCVVCKKEARNSSIYCSDACILAHAQETLTKDKPAGTTVATPKAAKSTTLDSVAKAKSEARVIVLERKTGRILTGMDAPTKSNLRMWLKENPTFEVVGANSLSTMQIGGKMVTTIQTQAPGRAAKSSTTLTTSNKVQGVPKMIYTKVAGSKQMILTSSNKKFSMVPGSQGHFLQPQQQQQQQQSQPQSQQVQVSNTKSPLQLKQALLGNSGKGTLILKPGAAAKSPAQAQPVKTTTVSASPKQAPVNNKKLETKQTVLQTKPIAKPSPPRKPETEPIRVNIRKTLTELLASRIKEAEDLKLSEDEIADLAVNIELEMYKYFKDTGAKYKAKYRSLVFNIKDTKNLTLFRKIADRSLTPDAVVRLSPDEMASQELAEWREKETKHQLEMIKKNELDLMAQAKSIVVKTHKGEQIIENDGGIDHVDPKTPVQDIVTALNSGDSISSSLEDVDKEREKERGDSKTKDDSRKTKTLEEKRKKEKEKERGRERDKDKEVTGRSKGSSSRRGRSVSRTRHRHSKERDRSKTRDKSRGERKSSRNKESRREKEKERERIKEREKSKGREKEGKEDKSSRQKEKDRRKGVNTDHSRGRGDSKTESEKREEERKKDLDMKDDDQRQNAFGQSTGTSLGSPSMGHSEKSIEDRLWRHIEDEATTNTIDGNDSDVSDREPSSTVNIKTPDINEESEREREQMEPIEREIPKGGYQTVWRGFVNMVDVAKFFITAQEVSGHARDLMDDLPDTVDVVGRISHETVWDYISKMKRTGSKEILVIRLTAANDEEKIPYITLYSYLNSRSRLGVVGNVSKNIKDFYIMPFSSQSTIPPVLLPLIGPGFEDHRPHLLLGIIVRNKRKRVSAIPAGISSGIPNKVTKKESDRSYTPPLTHGSKEKSGSVGQSASPAATAYQKAVAAIDSATKEKQSVTQTTLESLNRAQIGMSRSVIDTAAICKIVPELSSKIDLTSSPVKPPIDDGDEPYSPGGMDDDDDDAMNFNLRGVTTSSSSTVNQLSSITSGIDAVTGMMSGPKSSSELQRKMDELNRQIEEQKQQIQNISSSFLGDSTATLPGLGLDPPETNDSDEAYSPSDSRSFTPPPPSGISKLTQPILEKVSNITIPPNLQEILANVKRQESSKVDPYLPSKPSASFLPAVNAANYQSSEKYNSSSSVSSKMSGTIGSTADKTSYGIMQQRDQPSQSKESKSTLSSLSDLDLIRKAEEELAAVAAASASATSPAVTNNVSVTGSAGSIHTLSQTPVVISASPNLQPPLQSPLQPPITSAIPPNLQPTHPSAGLPLGPLSLSTPATSDPLRENSFKKAFSDPFKKTIAPEQPKPPGLEDEEFPQFPCTPPSMDSSSKSPLGKFLPKSGIILSVKRKVNDTGASNVPNKTPRTKSRWGQGPSDSVD